MRRWNWFWGWEEEADCDDEDIWEEGSWKLKGISTLDERSSLGNINISDDEEGFVELGFDILNCI